MHELRQLDEHVRGGSARESCTSSTHFNPCCDYCTLLHPWIPARFELKDSGHGCPRHNRSNTSSNPNTACLPDEEDGMDHSVAWRHSSGHEHPGGHWLLHMLQPRRRSQRQVLYSPLHRRPVPHPVLHRPCQVLHPNRELNIFAVGVGIQRWASTARHRNTKYSGEYA